MAGRNPARREKATRAESAAGDQLPEGGLPRFDALVHERLRLGILGALSATESLTFSELKKRLETTDGNLSVHARKLEEAGYISCAKSFQGRVPRTEYRMTAAGRRALENYIDRMEALIQALREK